MPFTPASLIATLPLHKASRLMDAETAHKAAILALKFSGGGNAPSHHPALQTTVAGLRFPSPLGLAAGFDKNAEVPAAVLALGFGFTEVGTLTPKAQPGNPGPRMFRLPGANGLINRLGFNNEGFAPALGRLSALRRNGIVGVNVGANKDSGDRAGDYAAGIDAFFDVADYFTINVSSPNTPGLRDLQEASAMTALLERVMERHAARAAGGRTPPVFVKIAPDMDDEAHEKLVRVIMASGAHGIIVSNTTVSRPLPQGLPHAGQTGGLSGRPLFALSTRMLARTRLMAGPDFPLIGAGGVESAETALEKIAAGADLVQLYTGLVYGGFGLARRINAGLAEAASGRSLAALKGTATARWAGA
jgi:dihydroorotate dehydrogenase